jgi:hypothetical protein
LDARLWHHHRRPCGGELKPGLAYLLFSVICTLAVLVIIAVGGGSGGF